MHQHDRDLFWLSVLLVLCAANATLSYHWLEKPEWSEAGWQVWQTFTTVGFGNAPPATTWGRISMAFWSTFGIFVLANVVSKFWEKRDFQHEQRRLGMEANPYRNAYILIHFPGVEAFLKLAQELRRAEHDAPFCVVDEDLESLPTSVALLDHVHFVRGSLLDQETFQRAKVATARTIIVYPHRSTDSRSDAVTQTVVETLERLTEEKVRIVYFLVSPKNAWLFKDCRVATRIVQELETLVLVQELTDAGTAAWVDSLLHNSVDASPTTVTPNRTVGMSWGDFCVACARANGSDPKKRATPLALFRAGVPHSCPDPALVIQADDRLSLATMPEFDWADFEQHL